MSISQIVPFASSSVTTVAVEPDEMRALTSAMDSMWGALTESRAHLLESSSATNEMTQRVFAEQSEHLASFFKTLGELQCQLIAEGGRYRELEAGFHRETRSWEELIRDIHANVKVLNKDVRVLSGKPATEEPTVGAGAIVLVSGEPAAPADICRELGDLAAAVDTLRRSFTDVSLKMDSGAVKLAAATARADIAESKLVAAEAKLSALKGTAAYQLTEAWDGIIRMAALFENWAVWVYQDGKKRALDTLYNG